jgi:hypothetical protein
MLVDDGEPRVDRGAMPRVDRTIDRRREDDRAALLQALEALAPCGMIRCAAGAGDDDQASALGEARQRGRDMPKRCIRPAAIDVRECRERRVHQNDAGAGASVEAIVDLCRIGARHGDIREEMGEQAGAYLGQLVEHERGSGQLGKDGEQPGPGRWFKDTVGRRDRCRGTDCQAERERRRELLERLALPGAPRVGREQVRHLRQHLQQRGGRCGARGHRGTEPAQEQDGRRLTGVVGALPVPGALRVAAAEGLLHRSPEPGGIDAMAAFEIGKQQLRSLEQGGCMSESFGRASAGRGNGCRDSGGRRHDEASGGEGNGRSRGSLSRSRPARPSGLFLSLWRRGSWGRAPKTCAVPAEEKPPTKPGARLYRSGGGA